MIPVQVSAKHGVVAVPMTAAVREMFPNAQYVSLRGQDLVAVPHTPDRAFMLRKLGFDVPAPILVRYDWPGTKRPFDVQKKTCAMLTSNQRAYVLNGLGTGKTVTALWSWDSLNKWGCVGKLLVLAPLSTLTFTWAAEVFATLPHRKCVVLHGTKAQRLERLADPDAEIFILNHDGVKVLGAELAARSDINALVVDELAVYRNGSAQRTKDLRKVAYRMKWAVGMTGAPIPNQPTDAWAQATIITPHTVPKFFGRFRDELMTREGQFRWVPKRDAVEKAFAVLQPAVRYTLDDIVELPDCIVRTVDVELGPLQAKIYKTLVDKAHAQVESKQITAANAAAVMIKLLQVATGWVYSNDRGIVSLDNEGRIRALIDAVLASDRKVLVFVPFKHALAGISAALTEEGIEHATVSGDTSANERSHIFSIFQNTSKLHCLAAHPKCLAHGITLTAADTIIWFSPVTSLETYEQANARITRIGQKHKQLILHFQGTQVERKIYTMLRSKQRVQAKLLELFEDASRDLKN